jgi:hypothetical protein
LLDTCHFLVNCVTKGPINECVLIIYYPLYRSCKCSGGNSFIISGCASMYCRIVVLLSARYEWSIKFLCASCPNLIEARIQCLKYTRQGSNESSQIFSTPQRPYLKGIRTLFIRMYSVCVVLEWVFEYLWCQSSSDLIRSRRYSSSVNLTHIMA